MLAYLFTAPTLFALGIVLGCLVAALDHRGAVKTRGGGAVMRTLGEGLGLAMVIALVLYCANHRPSEEAARAAMSAGWVVESVTETDVPGCTERGERVAYRIDGAEPDGGTRGFVCCQTFAETCEVMR